MFWLIRRTHIRVSARSSGVLPINGGSGWISSKYSQIAVTSQMAVPSSSCSAGSSPSGLIVLMNGSRRFSRSDRPAAVEGQAFLLPKIQAIHGLGARD